MKYISLETNSLVTIVGRVNDAIDWQRIGTTVALLNLTDIKESTINPLTGKVFYVLPVEDLLKAGEFKNYCETTYKIHVDILDETDALNRINEFRATTQEQ